MRGRPLYIESVELSRQTVAESRFCSNRPPRAKACGGGSPLNNQRHKMTLTVKIKNDGNQPGDSVLISGVEQVGEGDYVKMTGNPDDKVVLLEGEEVSCCPPTGHFDDPVTLTMKGKH